MSMDERGPASEAPMEALSKATAPSDEPSAPEGESESFWSRRTFFKSAALGTAAAAMYEAGSGALFGPLVAYADNLSGLNCTANDVRIPGPAQILNEPCACSGSFNAQVQFRVINNTGTTRYCVTAHLCPATLPNGSTFDPGDIVIGDVPPKSDALYTVTVPNYPCGSGLVCFGAAGPEADGGFPKGAPCPAGACCSTVSWDVNTGCPSRVLSSKCRHQQICIQGRGGATLDCDTSLTGVQSNCAVACGGTTTLRLCTTEAASFGPFTFSLSDGQSVTGTGPCADFTVGPITDTATFTGTVTSNDGCAKSASVTLTTTAINVELAVSGGEQCGDGDLTFTGSTGQTGCSYDFSVDGASVQNSMAATFSYSANPDSDCHTVSVVATCGDCVSAPDSITVSQCVTTTTPC